MTFLPSFFSLLYPETDVLWLSWERDQAPGLMKHSGLTGHSSVDKCRGTGTCDTKKERAAQAWEGSREKWTGHLS